MPSVEVTILVDSIAGMLAKSTDNVKRFNGEPLIAEPGFAVLIDLPPENLRVLWDAGASASAVLENLRRMEIDPTSIDVIALSHGHWDHVAGLSEILRAVRSSPELRMFPAGTTDEELAEYAKPRTIPLVVHPAAFRERWSFRKDGVPYDACGQVATSLRLPGWARGSRKPRKRRARPAPSSGTSPAGSP